ARADAVVSRGEVQQPESAVRADCGGDWQWFVERVVAKLPIHALPTHATGVHGSEEEQCGCKGGDVRAIAVAGHRKRAWLEGAVARGRCDQPYCGAKEERADHQ